MTTIEEQVYGQSRYRTTKAEIVEYYQETYPHKGKGGWKQHLIHDLSVITGMKPKSLEKRFENRINNPEKKNASQYRELGETLPPMPVKGYHVKGTVYIRYSKECVARNIDITITGNDAKMFQTMPDVQGVVNIYNEQGYEEEGYASCDEPQVEVTPIY